MGLWYVERSLTMRAAGSFGAAIAMGVGLAGAGLVLGPALSKSMEAVRLLVLCGGGLSLYVGLAWAVGAIGRADLALLAKNP